VNLALPPLDLGAYRLLLAGATFLAVVHAYRKLSPYFAVTWFGAGVLFAYFWGGQSAHAEVLLLPALVIYVAAAATKGLVETRPRLAGNHPLHVLMTGALSGVLAMPFETCSRSMGWGLPRRVGRPLLGVDADWLGGVPLDAVLLWALAGACFYGLYKVLDHIGLGRALQTVLLFGAAPFLGQGVDQLHGLVG
jgi:hypothetical protein